MPIRGRATFVQLLFFCAAIQCLLCTSKYLFQSGFGLHKLLTLDVRVKLDSRLIVLAQGQGRMDYAHGQGRKSHGAGWADGACR